MIGSWTRRTGLVLVALAWGCGSEQSKLDRGIAVDREQAVPSSDAELEETAAERREQEDRELDRKSREAFDRAQEEARTR